MSTGMAADDVMRVAVGFGGTVASLVPLQARQDFARDRASFRVDFVSGVRVKARCFENPEAAAEQTRLRAELPDAFVPVLHRSGPVVLEQWVDGVPWDAAERSADDIRSAAALLAAVHQVRRAAGQELPYAAPVNDVIAMNQGNLALLTATGALSTQEESALQPKLAAAPPAAAHALLHTDFCPENIVKSSDGALWVVDNEHLRVGAVDMDLARSWARWDPERPWSDPQREQEWNLFAAAYVEAGGASDLSASRKLGDVIDHQEFWRLSALTLGAAVLVRGGAQKSPAATNGLDYLRNAAGVTS